MVRKHLASLFRRLDHSRRKTMRFRERRSLIANVCQTESLEDRLLLAVTTVDGRSNIFGAGLLSAPGFDPGVLPESVAIPSGTRYIEFSSVTGTVSLDGVDPDTRPFFGADGGDFAPNGGLGLTNIGSQGGISGIRYHRNTFLVGVFVGSDVPTNVAPGVLDFSHNADFLSLSPQLQQTFFIGDGRTGSSGGYLQKFFVPSGATRIFLGLADGFEPSSQTISGAPRFYGDNVGSYVVHSSFVASDVPMVVDGRSNLFGAGQTSLPGIAPGIAPQSVLIPPNTSFIEFSSVTGAVSFDTDEPGTRPYINADGEPYSPQGASAATNINSSGGISGLRHSVNTFLAGVFLSNSPPTAPAPQVLDFSFNTDFLSLSPLLQQSFFIGDGRTGSGIVQRFLVPTGATRLFLGTVDGYDPSTDTISGDPGIYDDNGGAFDVRISLSNRVNGTAGNDVFRVTSSGVFLNGSFVKSINSENLTLAGLGGNDQYQFDADSNLGKIVLEETNELGLDTVDFSLTTTQGINVNLSLGSLQVVNPFLTLQLNSGTLFENLIGGRQNDVLTGNSLNNAVYGLAGNDTIRGGLGSDTLFGGPGDDAFLFSQTDTRVEADLVTELSNEGTDTLNFSAQVRPMILSLASASVQNVHVGRTLRLNAGSTFENAVGGPFNDTIIGNSLNNTLSGGPGNDQITGAGGNDILLGGAGSDQYNLGIVSGHETDTVTELPREGTDLLNFAQQTGAVILNLSLNTPQNVHARRTLVLTTGLNIEEAVGGSGDDILIGNARPNRLIGNAGNDVLTGLDGDDRISGGAGRNVMIGGSGFDVLIGGDDEDIVIAGSTTFDTVIGKLYVVETEWSSSRSYSTRIANLRAGVGVSKTALRARVSVIGDGNTVDRLTSGTGRDWFFRAVDDHFADQVSSEVTDLL